MTDSIAKAIAVEVVALLKAEGLVVAAAAPAPAPTKPAGKAKADKPEPAPAAAPAPAAEAPKRDDVHAALSAYASKHSKDAALVILHKYSPTLNGLAEDKFAEVIAALSTEPKAVESEFD